MIEILISVFADKRRTTSSILFAGHVCMAAAILFALLGSALAVHFGLPAFLLELIGWSLYAADAAQVKREAQPKPFAEVVGKELRVTQAGGIPKAIPLTGIITARVGDESRDHLGIILTNDAGKSYQHYILTAHPERAHIVEIINAAMSER